MSRRSKSGALPSTWRWRRVITRDAETLWTERLVADGARNWMIIERPDRVRLRVEAHFASARPAKELVLRWGGRADQIKPVSPAPGKPTQVTRTFVIDHDEKRAPEPGRLIIPYGMAFGSGEHATTLMLLRALAHRAYPVEETILDLGTGSGVLALTARRLGARHIVATDFDPSAIRTARQNEAINFRGHLVRWAVADVLKLQGTRDHSLILANLFSGLLIQAASRLERALRPGGELWLSGVLRSQDKEVAAALRATGLRLVKTTRLGKWVMQRWAKPSPSRRQAKPGVVRKTTQTK